VLEDTEILFRQLRRKLDGVTKAAHGTRDWEKHDTVRLLATLELPEETVIDPEHWDYEATFLKIAHLKHALLEALLHASPECSYMHPVPECSKLCIDPFVVAVSSLSHPPSVASAYACVCVMPGHGSQRRR